MITKQLLFINPSLWITMVAVPSIRISTAGRKPGDGHVQHVLEVQRLQPGYQSVGR